MTTDQIKYMVNRFLGWRLPDDFNPDAGISFKKTFNDHLPQPMKHEPLGTNLFDATQADVMVRYMLEGMPESSPSHTALAWREMAEAPRDGGDIIVYDPDLGKDDRVQIAFWNDILNYWQPLNDNSADPQPICWMPKPPPPGTEPPQSINSELLEAAKAIKIALEGGGKLDKRSAPIGGRTFLAMLKAAISNAEKAI